VDWEHQGKRKDQVEFSYKMMVGCWIAMMVLIVINLIWRALMG
tara:strand:+ start:514 stop:642 length:129 start_codon:yes stop_codon:yes gene_type:complete